MRYEDEIDRYRNLDQGRYEAYEREPYGQGYPDRLHAGYRQRGYRDDYDARRSWERRRWEGRADYLKCRDIMTKDVTTCGPTSTLRDVAEKMDDENVGSIPVVENGRLAGIVTDRDIVCRVLAEERDTRSSTAADAMTQDVVTASPEEPIIETVHKMGEFMIRRIPVVDHSGRLRGIVSMADIALEAELDRDLARALEQISRPTPYKSHRYPEWR